MMSYRKIIHIDMDAFYAAVEQRDNPSLKGKPIVVGSERERGVICTASYEARKYGVRSAMSSVKARQLCPELIFMPLRMATYKEVSLQIREIFSRYTDKIEPLSLDEAYLDVTDNKLGIDLAVDIAKRIKKDIKTELSLVASAGVSYNKLLAKLASDLRKPDGLCTIHPDKALEVLDALPVSKLWGVGDVTAKKMNSLGIQNVLQLRQCSKQMLHKNFGKMGYLFYDFARGIDHREVETDYTRRSLGCEHTFDKDITASSSIIIELYNIVLELVSRIRRSAFEGNTITVKVKYEDFTNVSRSRTKHKPLKTKDEILPLAKELLRSLPETDKGIRLIGVSVSNNKSSSADEGVIYYKQLKIPFKEFKM